MSSYLAAVLLSLVPPPGLASPVTCTSPGLQCGVAGPSLLAAVPRVAGLQQCRALCRGRDHCRYLAYHDQAAAPASHFCLLFTSCDTVTPCSHCVSERRDCLMDTCGSSIVGDLDENVLSSIPNTESEMECKALCANNNECAFYTYFLPADSLYPRICFLQTELAPPLQPCPSCSTGPANCSAAAPCSLALGSSGQAATSLVLTSVTETQDITVTGWGPCTVSMLLVGGGGQGGGSSSLSAWSPAPSSGPRLGTRGKLPQSRSAARAWPRVRAMGAGAMGTVSLLTVCRVSSWLRPHLSLNNNSFYLYKTIF